MDDIAEAVEEKWDTRVKGILKAALKRRGVTYAQLADKLATMGVTENERNIRNKIARGSFTAVFFVQCLTAVGVDTLSLR